MIEKNEYKGKNGVTYIIKKIPNVDGEFVKALRKKLGLSQTMFATLMRVSNKAVEKWEQGANPVTNGNAVAMVMFDRNPSLVNMFIERSEGTFEPDISDISVEEEPYIKNLELAKAK